jgi:creatinine amidohydrolase
VLLEKMNWMDVEKYLEIDQRVVLALGATEQHGYLSLLTDSLIPWEIAFRACNQEGVILAPLLNFGLSHWALDYPGTISLKSVTYTGVIQDIVGSLLRAGFQRFFLLNGHSGNRNAREAAAEAITDMAGARAWFYSWWELPGTAEFIKSHGEIAHANWVENFPFTRVGPIPEVSPPKNNHSYRRSAAAWKIDFPIGSMNGISQAPDETMQELLKIAVEDTIAILREMRL